jgi:hypothetical protein
MASWRQSPLTTSSTDLQPFSILESIRLDLGYRMDVHP